MSRQGQVDRSALSQSGGWPPTWKIERNYLTIVSSGMASAAGRTSKVLNLPKRSSNSIRLATFISTLLRSVRKKASSLFVAIDCVCKFVYAELHEEANKMIAAVPYKIHTVLTDNGIQFTNRKRDQYAFQHIFDRICQEHGVAHRLTKTNHPWTNGQVERMNRTLKDATVKKYDYQTHQHLREHLYTFLMAYNFAKRLKTLKGLTLYEYICGSWQKEPERFISNPYHHTLGLNS
jgi:hypothetical protein